MSSFLSFLNDNAGALSVVFSAIVMIATVFYAVLTMTLVRETRQMRQVQTEPLVEIFAQPKEEFVSIIHLVIKNIGLGPAYDISFSLTSDSDSEGGKALIDDFSRSKFLYSGLRYLGPGQEVKSSFTNFHQQTHAKLAAKLRIEICYRNSSGDKKKNNVVLDFNEFQGYGAVGKPHLYSIAQSLEKLSQDIQRISSGFNRIRVETFNAQDREAERIELEEQLNPKDF